MPLAIDADDAAGPQWATKVRRSSVARCSVSSAGDQPLSSVSASNMSVEISAQSMPTARSGVHSGASLPASASAWHRRVRS